MIRLIHAEFVKVRTTQVWFWLLLATIVVSGLLVVAQVAPSDGIRHPDEVPDLFAAFAATPAYLLVFVLGVLGVTTEFRYQTITPTLLQTPSRWALVTAKMITYAILGALYALVALVVEAVVGVPWLSSKYSLHVHWGNSEVQRAIWGTFAIIALFGIIGLGIGALLKNQVVAVVVGILFLAVLENVLVAIPVVKHVFPYTPNGAVQAVLTTHGSRTVNGIDLLSAGGGIVVLLLWAFIPAILGAAVTLNRDIT